MIRQRRGQEFVSGFMVILIAILIAAGLADYNRLQTTRDAIERASYEAALRGTSAGRDWTYAAANGTMRLNGLTAQSAASAYLAQAMSDAGLNGYTSDIRVLPNPTGGAIANFPPTARASAFDAATWTTTQPAVGVYVEIAVPTMLLGLINGGANVTLHAFGAAEAQN